MLSQIFIAWSITNELMVGKVPGSPISNKSRFSFSLLPKLAEPFENSFNLEET